VYRDNVDDFETLLYANGDDLRRTITVIRDAALAAPKGKAFEGVAKAARRG
jgi:hypothetical protein